MKKLFPLLLVLAATFFGACHNEAFDPSQKKGSSGKTLELMVVADRQVYHGAAKELIASIFGRAEAGIP